MTSTKKSNTKEERSAIDHTETLRSIRDYAGKSLRLIRREGDRSRSIRPHSTTTSVSTDDEEAIPGNELLVTIYLWDEYISYYHFTKDMKSRNATIFKFIHMLSNVTRWEGVLQQRRFISGIITGMFGFSIKFDCNYLLLLIQYMCDCDFDPRNVGENNSIFSITEFVHNVIVETWNSSILKKVKPKGKTLLSCHHEIESFLQWLTLELLFEEGNFHPDPSVQIPTIINELIFTINNVLDTNGNAGTIRFFLLQISKQVRCFHLKIATKAHHRMIFAYAMSGRLLQTCWNSNDKYNYFK